jgi:excisionase family DNA binding protein
MTTQKEVGVRQAAAVLGVTVDSVYRSVWSGRLPARKEGREVLIPASVVEQYRSERAARLRAQLDRLRREQLQRCREEFRSSRAEV